MSNPSQSILIIGAGAFGLSTALFLARRGYKDVTVIDRSPFHKNHYSFDEGADGASADINKVFRTGYGDRVMYEKLALKALPVWEDWTDTIRHANHADLPDGLRNEDELLVKCGFMRFGQGKAMTQHYEESLNALSKDGRRDSVFVLHDRADARRARAMDDKDPSKSWSTKLKRYAQVRRGDIHGLLDLDGGYTRADKACVWALHLCKLAGVRFILDETAGHFQGFIKDGSRYLGAETTDGKSHYADKIIVAAGGWTASIVPEVSRLLETTGGSVAFIDIPEHRRDLRRRFSPDSSCVWSVKLPQQPDDAAGSYRSMGGFPADPNGRIKLGWREIKYTNYETLPTGERVSVPRTRFSSRPLKNLTKEALSAIKDNVKTLFPELAEIGITGTRMCWYTDSIDNHFVGDYVPGTQETLFVASGGSGHGFKFLPVFGENFVNMLEKKPDEFTQYWKWRKVNAGELANGLEEGEYGSRVLSTIAMATEEDWKFVDSEAPAFQRARL